MSAITQRSLFLHYMRSIPLSPYAVFRNEQIFEGKIQRLISSIQANDSSSSDAQSQKALHQINAFKKRIEQKHRGMEDWSFERNPFDRASSYFVVSYCMPTSLESPLHTTEHSWRNADDTKRLEYLIYSQRNQKLFSEFVDLMKQTCKATPKKNMPLQASTTLTHQEPADDCSKGYGDSPGTDLVVQNDCSFRRFESLLNEVFVTIQRDVVAIFEKVLHEQGWISQTDKVASAGQVKRSMSKKRRSIAMKKASSM